MHTVGCELASVVLGVAVLTCLWCSVSLCLRSPSRRSSRYAGGCLSIFSLALSPLIFFLAGLLCFLARHCSLSTACLSLSLFQELPTPVATLMKSTEPHADSYYQLRLEELLSDLGFRHVTTELTDPRHRTVTATA